MKKFQEAMSFIKDRGYSAGEISRFTHDNPGPKGKTLSEVGLKRILDGEVDKPHRTTRDLIVRFYESELELRSGTSTLNEGTDVYLSKKEVQRISELIVANKKLFMNNSTFKLDRENDIKDGVIKFLKERLDSDS